MPIPRATVRLQLHADFGFDAALSTVDYFSTLGISHLYLSPVVTAQPGSTHGYDGIDTSCVSEALGGEAALRRLAARLHECGMGLIVDIVPNHMGIAGGNNVWWQDVLEWGQSSQYATWFDIDWHHQDEALKGKVLLPFLGQQYGETLAAGELTLQFDKTQGKIFISYATNRFPIGPECYPAILGRAEALLLEYTIKTFQGCDAASRNSVEHGFTQLKEIARTPDGLAAVDAALAFYHPATANGATALHALLEAQHYRLAWWRYGADSLNWLRFFEVTEFAGMRVEIDEVFQATHALVLRLYAEGVIDGVRVDHIDGFADPTAYCQRLRQCLATHAAQRPQGDDGPAYVVVEKILAAGELLRQDWQIDGTTGYDFMDQVGAFLHDPRGVAELDLAWADAKPGALPFQQEVQAARRQLLAFNLATEFDATCQALLELARCNLATRDYSLNAIKRVYTELLVQFPVYRTYVRHNGAEATDAQIFLVAMTKAMPYVDRHDFDLLMQINCWLGGAPLLVGIAAEKQVLAIKRFQQLTPPLVAKSVEDTAFYRYGRLLSRNQVGSDPGQLAMSTAHFHEACQNRSAHFPHAMLATATHDHKRGEDATARLAVLSELPQRWRACLARWRNMNMRYQAYEHQSKNGPMPSAADEAMLYQTLIGVWPVGLAADNVAGIVALKERVQSWQQKAIREAKIATDWAEPNIAHEQACADFLNAIFSNLPNNIFVQELADFARELAPSGAVNSLTQTMLRMTLPGVPDLYQGTEFWDFSLVDPDNRQPVDYDARASSLTNYALEEINQVPWQTGALKQRIISATLAYRKHFPEVFSTGSYEALLVEGPLADKIFAFMRRKNSNELIVVVARLVASFTVATDSIWIDPTTWLGTKIILPTGSAQDWSEVLTSRQCSAYENCLAIETILTNATVALLSNVSAGQTPPSGHAQ